MSIIRYIQFIPKFNEVEVEYEEGEEQIVQMHDGPAIKLKKLDREYDPTNKWRAMELLEEARKKQEFVTGLIYINEQRKTLPDVMQMSQTPLAALPNEKLRPTREAFAQVMAEL